MKDKGILLEVRGSKGIVMTADGRFEPVAVTSADNVGDEIQFQRRSGFAGMFTASAARRKGLGARGIAAALIIGLMVTLVAEAVRVQGTAVAYVEVDINPAVELGIDRNNRVISVEGLDKDGRDVIDGLHLRHLALEQAVEKVAGVAEAKGYVSPGSEDNTVLITVTPAKGSAVDPETSQRVEAARQAVSRTLESKNVRGTVQVIHTVPEVRKQAKEMNISPGQLALMLKAKEQGIEALEGDGKEPAKGPEKEPEREPEKKHEKKPEQKPEKEARSSARVLEQIIKDAKEEKDWPGLIEKFGEEVKKDLKSLDPSSDREKKGKGENGEKGRQKNAGREGDGKQPGAGERKPEERIGDQRPTRGESAWDRWRKGLGKAKVRGGGSVGEREPGEDHDD